MLTEALDGVYHLALEGLPAHLAVRDDREASAFLKRDRPIHGPVLGALELGGGDLAAREAPPGPEQLRRTQEAPDDVRPGGDHRPRSS